MVSPLPDQAGFGFIYCGLHTNNFHVVKPLSKNFKTRVDPKSKVDSDSEGVFEAINYMSQIMSRHSDLILRLVYQNNLLQRYRSWEEFLSYLITNQGNDPEIGQLVANIVEFMNSNSNTTNNQFLIEKKKQEKLEKIES